ncbi:hypothetical protein [uncultured Cellulomonas sp.]|uniref:hypothetical protein n=1 Tax=uncultured Cellulomonas sp. TaxID=189682 RepID=UPI0026261C49|nr:hypothetical protein [uncultured Cellulomonas sp.]
MSRTLTRRTGAAALALSAVAALTACSPTSLIPGGVSVGGDAPEDVAVEFLEEFNEGDVEDACELVDVEGQFAGNAADCTESLEVVTGLWTQEDESTWEVEESVVDDDGTAAQVRIALEDSTPVAVALEKIDGEWLIVNFG